MSRASESAKAKIKPKRTKARKVALYFVLALVFVRFTMIHQILQYFLDRDIYLLYFVALPVLIAIPTMGGFKRAFRYQPAFYWTAFAIWLIPTSIFSSWKSGSIALILGYYRTELVLLFAVAGLVVTWTECRWLMYTIAATAFVNAISFLLLKHVDENGRTSLVFGTVSNSNDYSGHLLFVLPFLLWIVLVERSKYIRLVALFALVLALFEVLAAGSRGAMLGLTIAVIIFTITTTARVRRIVLIAAPILAVLVLALLPGSVRNRIFTFTGSASHSEALESSQDREQLLKDAIATTIKHPLFGVGPGQFVNTEGQQTAHSEQRLWLGAHNSFMQIGSENGLPGLIFYVGGIFSSLLLLNRTGRLLAGKRGVKQAATAVMCVRISLISFCVTIFFLNFGYFFYLPALAGIAIAVAASSKQLVMDLRAKEAQMQSTAASVPEIEPPDFGTSEWST